jgi:acyl-CoA thioester hydrolase
LSKQTLSINTEVPVRFSEVDSLKIVWHGHYIKYMEDGREAFGKKYGLGYLDYFNNDLLTPIVKINIDYKNPLLYGDTAIIETAFMDCDAAKIIFNYKIFRSSDHQIVATGESIQVFLNNEKELWLTLPPFFIEWKKKMGLI